MGRVINSKLSLEYYHCIFEVFNDFLVDKTKDIKMRLIMNVK